MPEPVCAVWYGGIRGRKLSRANSIRRCEAVGYIDIDTVRSAFGMADPGEQRTAEQAANQ